MRSHAMPPRETQWVERFSYACLALILAIVTYGIAQPLLMTLVGAKALPERLFPPAILILLAGAPLVLEAGLLLTGSLERTRAWRVSGALALFGIASVLAPHAFFQSLPDAWVNPFVFQLITELALLSIVGALCLVAPRMMWWALALVVLHAAVALYVGGLPDAGPASPMGWVLARDATLVVALIGLTWGFVRGASGMRASETQLQ